MKKRKGLIVILIVCAISFAATIGLGIACAVTAYIHLDDGMLQRAWEEIVERYHLEDEAFGVEFPYDASEAGSDVGRRKPGFLHLEFGVPSAWIELDAEKENIELSL